MPRLEKRVLMLEKEATHADLEAMTDDELLAHASRFPMFSREMYAALLTKVGRYPSALPVVHNDPERLWAHYKE
jgi:hypothetical protein